MDVDDRKLVERMFSHGHLAVLSQFSIVHCDCLLISALCYQGRSQNFLRDNKRGSRGRAPVGVWTKPPEARENI